MRDAIADYAARTDRLSERERQQMMSVLERLRSAKATRPAAEVDDVVLYEWLRGPRTRAELAVREELFPSELVAAFGPSEAAIAARPLARLRRRASVHFTPALRSFSAVDSRSRLQ